MQKKIRKLIEYYGFENQMLKMLEELVELQLEIARHMQNDDNQNAIKEELADVLVVAEQLKLHFGKDEIENIMNYKLDRQLKRIRNEA